MVEGSKRSGGKRVARLRPLTTTDSTSTDGDETFLLVSPVAVRRRLKVGRGGSVTRICSGGRRRVVIEISSSEDEDECCVLDSDPFHPPTVGFKDNLSLSDSGSKKLKDEGIAIVDERGQVACRDYPHSRHLCAKFPFSKTAKETCCTMCYCYVCEVAAPCKYWKGSSGHCHASDQERKWKDLRRLHR